MSQNATLVDLRNMITGSADAFAALVADMQFSENPTVRAQGNEWAMKMRDAPKEFSAILSTMEAATKWLDDTAIREAITQSDARFADLTGLDERGRLIKGAVVSIVVPVEYLESHAPFIRIGVACGILAKQRAKRNRHRTLMMIDEFAALGRMDMVVRGLYTMRKYKLQFQLTVHSVGQLIAIYGQAVECAPTDGQGQAAVLTVCWAC